MSAFDPRPVVLTGGHSVRFGRDKLREPIDRDRWLIDVAIDALRGATGEPVTLVGACDPSVAARGDAHLEDDHGGQGPAGGVLTALVRIGDVVVSSGDLQRIDVAAVRALLDAARASDALVVRARGEPLVAVYRRALAPRIAERLRGGRRSLFDLASPPELLEVDLGGDLRDADTPDALVIWSFEEVEPGTLDLVPIAARRGLDHAGVHLSLAGWRGLAIDQRRALVTLGAEAEVDVRAVATIAADPRETRRITPATELPSVLPEGLALGADRARVEEAWPTLRPLERFAIQHAAQSAQRRGDPARLRTALAAIVRRERSWSGPGTAVLVESADGSEPAREPSLLNRSE